MKIFDYEEVVMNWDSYTYPIAVGTPVSVDGVLADNSSAHGLIARTVFAKPDGGDTLKIMTGGFIDMEEIVAGYGQELSSAAVQALCGIHFYKEGVCIPTGGSGGGDDSQKWKEETSTQLFSETVTTTTDDESIPSASITFEGDDPDGMIKAVFDGVTYELSPNTDYGYGAPYVPATDSYDFSVYPFTLEFDGGSCFLYTETSGEHTISVESISVTYTNTFSDGVKNNAVHWVTFTPPGLEEAYYVSDTDAGMIDTWVSNGEYVCGRTTSTGIYFLANSKARVFARFRIYEGNLIINTLSYVDTGDGLQYEQIDYTVLRTPTQE